LIEFPWEVVDDSYVRSDYLNGEYRVLSKEIGYYYLFGAPTCARDNYTVEVDARWQGSSGYGYGLVFDLVGNYDYYYVFMVSSYYQRFSLSVRTPSGWVTIVPNTSSSTINWGMTSNHLGVTRDGDLITLYINNTPMGTWSDSTVTGQGGTGLVSNPYTDLATSDARFDNFSMTSLQTTSVKNSSNIIPRIYGSYVLESHIESEPAPIGSGR